MTHIKNIPHIIKYGITHKDSPFANNEYLTIGDISLIDTRRTKVVSVDNGNYLNFNAPTITLGDYIPFYFGVKMPMLYVMQNGGNFVERATPAKDIIYLACPLSRVIELGNDYYFSDGHGTDSLTTFYDKRKIKELPTIVDWDAIRASYWGGQENLNLKRKKQAEFLVSNDLPSNIIRGFGCYNQDAKDKLINLGIDDEKIKIIPKAYY